MTAKLTQETEDNLVRARMALLDRHPFFGELVKFLRPTVSETVTQTACIDKHGHMHINPNFANRANAQDLLFVLAHEAMHLVNASHSRMPRDAVFGVWARAADIAINYLLVNEGGIRLPRKELITPLYEGFERYHNDTHEEIYDDLMKNAILLKIASGPGKWCDEESCKCGELFEMDPEEARKWQARIQAAAETAKGVGKLPGSLAEFLANIGLAKKNWIRVLALATQSELRKRFSWRRPNRRTASINVLTPGMEPERPEVVVYLDTSGSMHDELLNEGLSEISAILRIAKATLILSDAEVYYCGPIRREQLQKLPMQRGGTDFNVVFNRITEEKLKPRLFIGFSDLEGPFPERQPDYPVIWCRSSQSGARPPWGRLIEM